MKKSLIKVICALIILTLFIAIAQNSINPYSQSETISTWTGETKHVDNIIKKDEKSLNWLLTLYNSGMFKKIEIEDWVNLKWYILSGSEEKNTIFPLWWTQIVDNYFLVTTKKPVDTSITDLWLNLTGDTLINTVYNEESVFVSFLKEFGWIILFFLVFIIGFRLINDVKRKLSMMINGYKSLKKIYERNKQNKILRCSMNGRSEEWIDGSGRLSQTSREIS